MMLAISALVSAPNNVISPAMNQMPSSSSGEPTCAAMLADFLKIPEPMTPPTTIMMVVNSPSVGTSPKFAEEGTGRLPASLPFGESVFNVAVNYDRRFNSK